MENKNIDVVGRFIELKQDVKEKEKEIAALELLIFEGHRDDDRIRIISGRKTITLTPQAYEIIDLLGVPTTVSETRLKKLEEFDVDIQKSIVKAPENVNIKISKESIRIK